MQSRRWCFALVLCLVQMTASGQTDALRPKGNPGAVLNLASSGKTDYVILVPAKPTPQDTKAASELAEHLQQITHATFPQIIEGKDALPPGAKVLSVGRTDLLAHARCPEKEADLGNEGYAIAMDGENLFLFGGAKRGPLYAVFALLEEDLGVRWYAAEGYFPAATRIPAHADLRFSPVPRTYIPQFELRQPLLKETDNEIWALRNRVNAQYLFAGIREEWGGRFPLVRDYFCHTFDKLVPRAKYFKDHPEYFSMKDGKRNSVQLCASNPEVAKIIITELLAAIKTGHEVFSVSPNDGPGYCECPECKSLNDSEGSGSAAHLRMLNIVAAAIAEKHPDVRISHLAYLAADTACRTIRPHKNVIIQFCTDKDAWRWPFIPYTQTTITRDRLKGWLQQSSSVYVWDYVTNYSHALAPFPNMSVVAENIRFFAENKAAGIFLEANQNAGSERGAMRSWVWSKLLWDPSRDVQALMRDFTEGYYGPAAEPMQQYNDLLEKIYTTNLPRFKAEHEVSYEALYNVRFAPSVVFLARGPYIAEATKLFEKAERLATDSADQQLLRRVRLAKLPLLYVKLSRGPGYRSLEAYNYYDSADRFGQMIDEFEQIARDAKMAIVTDGTWDRYPPGRDLEFHLTAWRRMLERAKSGND